MSKVIFSNITKRFPGVAGATVVDRLNLTIEKGTLVILLGPSGCGKTTTLRMLAGFATPSDGTITIGGRDVTNVPVNARNVGMVFQSYALFPHTGVRENVEYGVRLLNPPCREMRDRVDSNLETMARKQYADRSPSRLSGGQQQRVALARAVVTQPKMLLFDEPSRTSTRNCASACAMSCAPSSSGSASPASTSPTTRVRRWRSQTGSWSRATASSSRTTHRLMFTPAPTPVSSPSSWARRTSSRARSKPSSNQAFGCG